MHIFYLMHNDKLEKQRYHHPCKYFLYQNASEPHLVCVRIAATERIKRVSSETFLASRRGLF
jgi:hypothetical protein